MNDNDGATTKRQSTYSNHKHSLLRKLREALSMSPQSVAVIDDSAKQQKITVKMSVSRETPAKST